MGKKVGSYTYEKSTRPKKKLMTKVGGKTIHFGHTDYGHFKDKTGIWKSKDHNDPKRRKNYRDRHKGILDKSGKPAYRDPSKASYHAYRILW